MSLSSLSSSSSCSSSSLYGNTRTLPKFFPEKIAIVSLTQIVTYLTPYEACRLPGVSRFFQKSTTCSNQIWDTLCQQFFPKRYVEHCHNYRVNNSDCPINSHAFLIKQFACLKVQSQLFPLSQQELGLGLYLNLALIRNAINTQKLFLTRTIRNGECVKSEYLPSLKNVGIRLNAGEYLSCTTEGILLFKKDIEGEVTTILLGHEDRILANVSLNDHDDRVIITASKDKTLRVWDTVARKELHVLRGHEDAVSSLSINYQGLIVSGSWDHSLRVWNPLEGKELRVLHGHRDKVLEVAFINERLVASTSEDQTLRVWDALNGRQLRILKGHEAMTQVVPFYFEMVKIDSTVTLTLKTWHFLQQLPNVIFHRFLDVPKIQTLVTEYAFAEAILPEKSKSKEQPAPRQISEQESKREKIATTKISPSEDLEPPKPKLPQRHHSLLISIFKSIFFSKTPLL